MLQSHSQQMNENVFFFQRFFLSVKIFLASNPGFDSQWQPNFFLNSVLLKQTNNNKKKKKKKKKKPEKEENRSKVWYKLA